MNFSAKQTNQSPVVVHRMRRFKFELHHQIIDEHTGICARIPISLQRAWQISPCWQVNNDRLCKLSSQNRVRNFGLSTYLPRPAVKVVKQRDGNTGSSAYRTQRSLHGEGALRGGSTRWCLSPVLNCERKRFVRTAVRLMPIRNNV